MKKKNSLGSNLVLLLASLGMTYLIIEVFIFSAFLPLMPLKFHAYLGDLYTLAQSSKSQLEPTDYIALVGDSYAQGKGDWLLSADHNRNSPFHSAHTIHEKTGRDVVTFGKSGAGSVDGIIINPIRNFSRINSSWAYALEPPKTIIVYFYEGNDLNNNLRTIRKYITAETGGADLDQNLEAFVADYYVKLSGPCAGLFGSGSCTGLLGNAFAARFLSNLTADTIQTWTKSPRRPAADQHAVRQQRKKAAESNKARISSSVRTIPAELQSPAMELDDQEIRISVKAFEIALAKLHLFFPEARIIVTIVPAPLTVYELASDQVTIQTYEGRSAVYPAAQVQQKSNHICNLVAAASHKAGADFIDIRGAIRATARKKLIHGPKDWKHFNEEGYVALGNVLSDFLAQPPGSSAGCEPL